MSPQRKQLENGMRIIAVPMKDNPTVTVLAMCGSGSHNETKEQNGISHFLEHMMFKGTPSRSSALVVSTELDALGAESNAFTWYEFTGYYGKARKENFERILDVVADVYQHPQFPEKEIEKERGVIIEEINLYEDQPMQSVYHVFDQVMYGDQPAGRKVLGEKEIIRTLSHEQFDEYHKKHYVAENTTVVVAGNIIPEIVFEKVAAVFKDTSQKEKPAKTPVHDTQEKPQVTTHYKESDQAHFVLGFRGIPAVSEQVAAYEMLSTILGRGMSSRLFQKLREEMGVCYYVRVNNQSHSDHGKFMISSGVDTKRINEVIAEILKELSKLKEELVSPEELTKAKEYTMGNLLMGHEGSDDQAEYYAWQEILGLSFQTLEEWVEELKGVTAEDIQNAAQELFVPEKMNLAVIGPYKDTKQFEEILRF